MIFGKKKENLSDKRAVYQKRKAPRFTLDATITIEGFEGEGALENISNSGCCMESATYVSIIPDDVYEVLIRPCNNDNIKPFYQKLKATWTKSSEKHFQAGFTLDGGQSNPHMEEYVKQLNAHGVNPDYGNMSKDD